MAMKCLVCYQPITEEQAYHEYGPQPAQGQTQVYIHLHPCEEILLDAFVGATSHLPKFVILDRAWARTTMAGPR